MLAGHLAAGLAALVAQRPPPRAQGTYGLEVEGASVRQGARTLGGFGTLRAAGEVLAKLDGQVAPQNVGQIQIAIFANEGGLEAVGDNMLLATPASGQAQLAAPGQPGYGQLMQGFIETSNVNAVQEITSLITAQRAYEMNSKVITATDEMLSTLARMR